MVTFDTLETGREGSRPIEVYNFTMGSEQFQFTSAEDDIVIPSGTNQGTYDAVPIARSDIAQGPDDRKKTLTLTVAADNVFAQRYINIVPGSRASLSILRIQRDAATFVGTDQILIFKGSVQSVRFPDDGQTAEIAVRPLEAAASRTIPRYTFMGLCNHVLYGPGCNVNPTGFQMTGLVTAVTANVVTISGANSQIDGYWTGGFAKPVGFSDFRLILRHVGEQLTLLLPFAENVLASQVQIFAGCDHRFTGHCATKFDNVIEFGGFPYVPTKNPFSVGLL